MAGMKVMLRLLALLLLAVCVDFLACSNVQRCIEVLGWVGLPRDDRSPKLGAPGPVYIVILYHVMLTLGKEAAQSRSEQS